MLLKMKRVRDLHGDITVSGAKNSAIPILCAAMLAEDAVTLKHIPDISDIHTLLDIIESIGFSFTFEANTLKIHPAKKINTTITHDNVKKMRGSYYIMGTLLALKHRVKMATSGGCDLGYRPINFHLDGFKRMGAVVEEKGSYLFLHAKKLKPTTIDLDFPSVGATINLMLACVKTKGMTVLNNCAKEPEIVDVANFLNQMGASIEGAGSEQIIIQGVERLHGTTYEIMSDRIEAGTYLILGALLHGATIRGINPQHLMSLIQLLKSSGYPIYYNDDKIMIEHPANTKPFQVVIGTYPGFPTDLGQPLSVLGTQIQGLSQIKETIFTKRIAHIQELNKMGAQLYIHEGTIVIEGKNKLKPSTLYAHDLRGGAALVMAASLCKSYSIIENIDVFLRGYEKPIEKLASFGIEAYLIDQK